MSYLYLDTEEEIVHQDDDSREVLYEEMLVRNGVIDESQTKAGLEAAAAQRAIEKTRTEMVAIYCSCGSMKCGMIKYFGLPKPTYKAEIAPLESQMIKDSTAARIKSYS